MLLRMLSDSNRPDSADFEPKGEGIVTAVTMPKKKKKNKNKSGSGKGSADTDVAFDNPLNELAEEDVFDVDGAEKFSPAFECEGADARTKEKMAAGM